MKILVKGTIKEELETRDEKFRDVDEQKVFHRKYGAVYSDNYEQYKSQFIATCKAIGKAIVRNNHDIIVGVPHWKQLRDGRAVANYIILGASEEATSNHTIIFYTPQDPEAPDETENVVDTIREFEDLPNINIEQRYLGRGNWSGAMIQDVDEADAVILIGGGDGTASIGYAAFSFGKPVIPITWFGGAAYDISSNFLFNNLAQNKDRYGLSSKEISSIQSQWCEEDDFVRKQNPLDKLDAGLPTTDNLLEPINTMVVPKNATTKTIKTKSEKNRESAELIVSLAVKLAKNYKRLNSVSQSVAQFTIWILILVAVLWVVVYLGGLPYLNSQKDLTLFCLLFIASIEGTGLRTLVSFVDEDAPPLTFTRFGIDIALGIGLALGLAMFYLVGSISFTGSVVELNAQASDFARIAVSMSLLGLAAGFLLPVEQLKHRLETSIEPQDKPTDSQ